MSIYTIKIINYILHIYLTFFIYRVLNTELILYLFNINFLAVVLSGFCIYKEHLLLYLFLILALNWKAFSFKQKAKESVFQVVAVFEQNGDGGEGRKLLFEEDFEGEQPFAKAHSMETGTNHALTYVNNPVCSGARAARFEIRVDDPLVKGSQRSEVTIIKGLPDKDMWYSFNVYFPADGFAPDVEQEVISQWYQSGSPATALRVKRDRFYLQTGNTMETREKIDLGPVAKDVWHEFVFHIRHSFSEDGIVEIWHNGSKVLTHEGGNMYDTILPKWKLGVYKASFKRGTSKVKQRIVYYDNIRVGGPEASLSDMTASPYLSN